MYQLIKLNLFLLLVASVHLSENEFSTCYEHLDCINFTKEWFDPELRPANVAPLERHVINTKFLLLTPVSNNNNTILYDTISSNPLTINITKYNRYNRVMILIHDFTTNGYTGWIKHMALQIFALNKYNVISVDWQAGAEPPFQQAISNARVVAREAQFLIKTLKTDYGLLLTQLHLIGHGVGAHIAGYIGKSIRNIARITGMPQIVKLSTTDAAYVEVLHTDGEGKHRQGTLKPMGHIDFYINNGSNQPGCTVNDEYNSVLYLTRDEIKEGTILPDCSHKRAFKYYLDSVCNKKCRYTGINGDKIVDFRKSGCVNTKTGDVICAAFGLDVDVETFSAQTNAKFTLETGGCMPYCKNAYQVVINFAKCTKAEENSNGYFNIHFSDGYNKVLEPATFNKDPRQLVLFHCISFVTIKIKSPSYAMDIIQDVELKWHYTTPFCFRCHNNTCIESLSVTLLKSINGPSVLPIVNEFCAKNGGYTLIKDGKTSNDFVKCEQNIQIKK
ncbi:uncharacterized protein CBL_00259 [Carabus blaptoides fortunei]